MKRAIFVLAAAVAFIAPSYQGALAATAPPSGVVAPNDPYITCGNWSYPLSEVSWEQCDAGYGPVFIQGQITTYQYDSYWGPHYNIVFYTAGGANKLRNYHLIYDGYGSGWFTWTISDPSNWIKHTVAEPGYDLTMSRDAAVALAQFIANDLGDSNLSTALLNSGGNIGYPSGKRGSLITACDDLLGRAPGNSH